MRVLLAGMRKGARGLNVMRETGSLTIVQDSASRVDCGVPKATSELEAVVSLPPNQIADDLMDFVRLKPIPQE